MCHFFGQFPPPIYNQFPATTINMYTKILCMCVYHNTNTVYCACTRCNSHCHVVTACFSASSFASCSQPGVCPTALTNDCHVRGSLPALSWRVTHLVTRSNIQSVVLSLFSSMSSISEGSTYRCVAKCFHLASTLNFSACRMSAIKWKNNNCMKVENVTIFYWHHNHSYQLGIWSQVNYWFVGQ